MKRTTRSLLAAILLFGVLLTLCACSAEGTYTLSSYETADGDWYGAYALDDAGINYENYYIVLEADGTGYIRFGNRELDVQWEDRAMWPVGNPADKLEFHTESNYLEIEWDGCLYTFEKQ